MANLVETLTDATRQIGVGAAYGAPVEIDGASLVPVALVWSGFGGGNGNASSPGTSGQKIGAGDAGGEGFGGGGVSIPIGAYVTEGGKATFEPNLIALLAVSIPVIMTTGWALARFVRALKK
ncbi:hypothetical protein [Herbiconiux solani]|uniref:hypothetical protein n=1 Tax=Herbiconiux solani TaxID=661329 RepID=UPI0008251311|nr:hypothetical protein [Herbiconiux solani]